jgi:Amt family ammonium transporter
VFASLALQKLKIDDPLDAFAVHGACGAFGLIATGIFATKENLQSAYAIAEPKTWGVFEGGGLELLGCQLLGVTVIAIWTVTHAAVIFVALKLTIGLRVPLEVEIMGLDIAHHGGEDDEHELAPLLHHEEKPDNQPDHHHHHSNDV